MASTHSSLHSANWSMAFVMPNLLLQDPFEFGDIAIVAGDDDRLVEVEARSSAATHLFSGFEDSLPHGRRPSAMLYKNPGSFADLRSAIVDARNLVAVVCACYGWLRSIGALNTFTTLYTDHFDFYPRWPTNDGKGLVYRGPALNFGTRSTQFKGSTYPYLSVDSFSHPVFDENLLESLAQAWRRVHITRRPTRHDRRLFRALSVAYDACRVPQVMDNDLYDHGKHCSLWVSAFESLAHSGKWSGHKQVVDLIGKRHLSDSRLKKRIPMKISKVRNQLMALNTVQRLYTRLYFARNDFLHGNPISIRDFILKQGQAGTVLHAAPLLFHAALEVSFPPKVAGSGSSNWIASILRHNELEEAFLFLLGLETRSF